MPFAYGDRSIKNLVGVHPTLVAVCHRAIEITTQDFAIIDGTRTAAEQEAAFFAKKSQIRAGGKHQIGLAVDVMACVGDLDRDGDKEENWEEKYYYPIASAFQQAGRELGVDLTWGAVWDRELCAMPDDVKAEAYAYFWKRKKGKGFFDIGHFELAFTTGMDQA